MDRERFFHLFVNANGLAELGFRAALADYESIDAGAPPGGEPEGTADPAGPYHGLDMNALEGLDFYGGGPGADAPAASGARSSPPPPGAAGGETTDPEDFETYLESAYRAGEHYADRVDSAFGKADTGKLERMLAALPDDLPPLTTRLTGEQLGEWLARYRESHEALADLLAEIRRLDS